MKPPKSLKGDALDFWKRHSKPLQDAGILTDRDYDSFLVLANIWAMIQNIQCNPDKSQPSEEAYRIMGQYDKLIKQYLAYAKQFGLLPRERKAADMEMTSKETDEFGI